MSLDVKCCDGRHLSNMSSKNKLAAVFLSISTLRGGDTKQKLGMELEAKSWTWNHPSFINVSLARALYTLGFQFFVIWLARDVGLNVFRLWGNWVICIFQFLNPISGIYGRNWTSASRPGGCPREERRLYCTGELSANDQWDWFTEQGNRREAGKD